MRLAVLALTGALVGSAQATPLTPALDAHNANIVQVAGGCGSGRDTVPGYFSYWRGGRIWVPAHCAPNRFGFYGGGYRY